jgi:radical SAM superfamily enzyme YgiQ (UPF0313 family)
MEPPLGLASLAAVARKNGASSSILDAAVLGYGLEETEGIISKENPDVLGITLTTLSLKTSSALGSRVRKRSPGIKIMVGGPHFTALPQKTLFDNPSFDIGIVGEGEKTLEELLRALSGKTPLTAVPGIMFRSEGKIVPTAPRDRIRDLDELPMPAFDLLPRLNRFYRLPTQSIKRMPCVSLVTSRGCPGRCLFCDRATFGNQVRLHSAEYVTEMMLKLQKDYGIRGVLFEDDNFFISEERLEALARSIKKKNIKIAWSALSRIDIMTERKLGIAKQCGCWQILYGIESGAQKILDFHKSKGPDDSKIGAFHQGFFHSRKSS